MSGVYLWRLKSGATRTIVVKRLAREHWCARWHSGQRLRVVRGTDGCSEYEVANLLRVMSYSHCVPGVWSLDDITVRP